jgi:hypothetical protein
MNVTTAERSKEKPMSTFTIDAENNITAHASSQEATLVEGAGVIQFNSQASLATASSDWPLSRFVEIWNSIPGNAEVTKFQNRKKAVARIWKAIQPLVDKGEPEVKSKKATKSAKPAKKPNAAKKVAKKVAGKATERSNKKAEVIAMMKRAKGVTLAEIMKVTGWQAHTVRGFVSILGGKGGEAIESSKNPEGERTYRIAK